MPYRWMWGHSGVQDMQHKYTPCSKWASEGEFFHRAIGVRRKDHRLQEVFGIVDAAEVRADNDGVLNRDSCHF